MTYALAKQLKDAGFECANSKFYNAEIGVAPDPTLSELIEACGESLRYLQRIENGGWFAGTHDSHESGIGLPDSNVWRGSTPEEAVTNLWLALNKK